MKMGIGDWGLGCGGWGVGGRAPPRPPQPPTAQPHEKKKKNILI